MLIAEIVDGSAVVLRPLLAFEKKNLIGDRWQCFVEDFLGPGRAVHRKISGILGPAGPSFLTDASPVVQHLIMVQGQPFAIPKIFLVQV